MARGRGDFRAMIIGMLVWAGGIAAEVAPPPFARVTLAERHARQAIERIDETPDLRDLRQRAVLFRDGAERVIITRQGRPIA